MNLDKIEYAPKTVKTATITFSAPDLDRLIAILSAHAEEKVYARDSAYSNLVGHFGIVDSGTAGTFLATLKALLGLFE